MKNDKLKIADKTLKSRLIIGTGKYKSFRNSKGCKSFQC